MARRSRRASEGAYSNTAPLSHFETQHDLFPGAVAPPIPDRVRVVPLVFLPAEDEAPLDLGAMWAASPLFQVEWPDA